MRDKSEVISENVPDVQQFAIDKLAAHLEVGVSLAQLCEDLANKSKGDRLGPIYAAARLMRANAMVADVLATAGGIERRRRSIVEHIQAPHPKPAELNSALEEKKPGAAESVERLRLLNERMRAARLQPGADGTAEEIAQIRAGLEGELARLETDFAGGSDG
jgi:hypothetical protein